MSFGAELKKLRKEKGISIRKAGELSNISHAYISQIENGKRDIPKPELLKKLSKALGIEYLDLMVKAGYLSEKERLEAFISEDFNIDDDIVYQRVLADRKHNDLYSLLKSTESVTINSHELATEEKEKILDLLKVIFPEYTKED